MKSILIVDDEEAIRRLYEMELTREGYAVTTACDAEEALAILSANRPDLVTVDIRLPGMDGISLVRAIKEKDRDLPVILVTAYENYKQEFSTWAANDYVVKSSDTGELKSAVRRFLG